LGLDGHEPAGWNGSAGHVWSVHGEGAALKILLIRLSAVGDVVRTLPALTCLRRAYPSAHITWAVEEPSREILQDQRDLDETLVFPRKALSRALLHPSELTAACGALSLFTASLKDARFDLVIDFQGTLKSGLMAWLTGAARRVGPGRGHAREMSYLFQTDRVRLGERALTRVERALALVAHLGVDISDATSEIPERPEDAAYVESFLSTLATPRLRERSGPPAVLFPGTSRTQAYKRYPPAQFARAADLLAERTGCPVVVAWGPGEERIAGEVVSAMRSPATLAPSMTLGQLTSLIRRSRIFLAGDTGPMHIAWTVGTPVVAIYGPTDPELNRPGGLHSATAYEKVFCSPCRNRGCIARTCLEHLPPEKVADSALGVLRQVEAARPDRGLAGPEGPRGPGASGRNRVSYETMGPGSRPGRGITE
jgi:lipopolysaccharide heptosyltransferase I